MLPDLYLIRHGETEWNRQERLQGRLDSPLTDVGRSQALALRKLVAGIDADRLCSPQGRAVETARIVFEGGFRLDPRLAEIDVGGFTGQRLAKLRPAHPEVFAEPGLGWYDRCPQGEGFVALKLRCRDLLASLRRPTAMIGHGITLRMIWALATDAGTDRLIEAPLHQGRVLPVLKGRGRLLDMAETGCQTARLPL